MLAVSGGLDSMALLKLFSIVLGAKGCQEKILVCHVHHGPGLQESFRNEALEFCRQYCLRESIPFVEERVAPKDESENQLREARYAALQKHCRGKVLVTAHHKDDLCESQFLHLLRGCGLEGLHGIRDWDSRRSIWRPLLIFSRVELENYQKERKFSYVDDPSNRDLNYKRNFLRHEVFPLMEKKYPGSIEGLSRSLSLILQNHEKSPSPLEANVLDGHADGVAWSDYLQLDRDERASLLAQYWRSRGHRGFSLSQIKEIQRYLDKGQRVHTFRVASFQWLVDERGFRTVKAPGSR